MLVEVKIPELAESVAEATLVSWLKQPGEKVEQGENLIEVETAIGVHVYEVREAPEQCRNEDGHCVVTPTELWVVEPREGDAALSSPTVTS